METNDMIDVARRGIVFVSMLVLCACSSYQAGFNPRYIPPERPSFVAQGELLLVLPKEQENFEYKGKASSWVGGDATLTLPLGMIVRDIAKEVFTSCFAKGVTFAERRSPGAGYVLALEGNLEQFIYSYTRVIDEGFSGENPDSWIVPEVQIAFEVRAYDGNDAEVLHKTYDSGIRAGRSYRVSSKPAERIDEALHATLHDLMLQVATDIRPLLTGKCEVTDR